MYDLSLLKASRALNLFYESFLHFGSNWTLAEWWVSTPSEALWSAEWISPHPNTLDLDVEEVSSIDQVAVYKSPGIVAL